MKYVQCLLVNGNAQQTCWIEAEYADEGLLVSLEEAPEDTWKVSKVYNATCSFSELNLQRKTQKTFKGKLK